MLGRLPELIDPFHLASRGEQLSGAVDVKRMERLRPLLINESAAVQAVLDFSVDDMAQPIVHGTLAGELTLLCQRCLEAMQWPIETRFTLGLVQNQYQMDRLPEGYEPWLVTEVPTSLTGIIEEEILLSLPIVATHDDDSCKLLKTAVAAPAEEAVAQRPNPFAVLKDLKKS